MNDRGEKSDAQGSHNEREQAAGSPQGGVSGQLNGGGASGGYTPRNTPGRPPARDHFNMTGVSPLFTT